MSETGAAAPETATDWGAIAIVLFLAAAVLVGVGFYTMFTYDSTSYGNGAGRFVEGDAYNYVIIATRGVGWMVAGVAAALGGVGATIARLHNKR